MPDHFLFSKKPHRYSDTFVKRKTAHDRDRQHSRHYTERIASRLAAIGSSKLETRSSDSDSEAAISRLPGEILGDIFKRVQIIGEDEEFDSCLDSGYDEWCWLTITHICKQWRDVAVGSRELWTHINITGLSGIEQTRVYLDRSGTSGIVVYCDNTKKRLESHHESLHLALGQFSRICELHVWNFKLWQLSDSLRVALQQYPAPVLQKFSLSMFSGNPLDVESLFNEEAPLLEEMSLQTDVLSWGNVITIGRNLRNLSIGSVSTPLTLKEIPFILSINPSLERLWIACLSDDANSDDSPYIPQSFDAPTLRDIGVFGGSYELLSELFAKVRMPNLQAWNIVCSSYPIKSVSETDPKMIIPCISRTTVDCETLVIVVRPGDVGIRVNCDDLLGQWEQGEKQRRSVAYAWDVDTEDARSKSVTVAEGFSFVCSVLEGGFWDSAKEMTLEIEGRKSDIRDQIKGENLGHQYWMQLFEMFPRITELSVSVRYITHSHMGANPIVLTTHDGLSILMALAEARKDDNGATQLICPHLERLNLFGMKLKTGLPHLGRALNFRAKCGNRLGFLYISASLGVTEAADSIVRAEIAARFINVVDEDELDGALGPNSDDDGCIS